MIMPVSKADFDDESPARSRVIHYPCSQSQLRFWIEEQLSPRNPALNVAVRWRLDGRLDHAVLEDAWQRLIERHEPLRTALRSVDDHPMQFVQAQLPFSIPVFDLRVLPEPDRLGEADRIATHEALTPFDIATAPLIRVTRVIVGDDTTILLVTAHHAICDGWSIGILAREMGLICSATAVGSAPVLPELALRFGDFAALERDQIERGALETERAYVREMLRDFRQFELLPDHPRPRRLTSNGAIASVLLDRALTDGVVLLARRNGCTLFMTALAALFALFHRYTGETDIVLGTQVVGRDEEELEKLVGCFINTIALRGDLSGNPAFDTLLERTRDMVSDTFEVRHLPLQQLVEIAQPIRDASRNALFSVNFIFQRSFIANESYGEFALVDLPSRSAGALYDINVFMVERPEGWRVSCEYNTDLFDGSTVSGLLDRFVNLLAAVVADPSTTIGKIEILSAADRHELVVAANSTDREYPQAMTLPMLVADQVARTPDAVAVVCAGQQLTFTELDARAQRLAGELRRRGCATGMRIGILLDRSVEMVVAMLGVLQAGCTYVPLDPKFPAERLRFIAHDAELVATITRPGLADAIGLPGEQCIFIDEDFDRLAVPIATGSTASPGDVAYVIYTSGSTGQPKGVQITHRALVNFLWAMRERPGLDASDTLVAVTTVSFDIAGLELFLPLITGAKLIIATESDVVDGAALLGLLREFGATVVQATPVTWQLLIDAGWNGDPELTMLCGGEALSRQLAEHLLERGSELWNMYGPTETTIWSAVGRISHALGPVLIGPPIANTQLYVLDSGGELVPPGVPGELYIAGDGVAQGYFKRDELTQERFVPNGFSAIAGARMYRTGDIVRSRGREFEFLGRTDHQVKLRGFRIELDEIAAVLLRQPGVADAVAIAVDDAAGETSIRAFVVAQPGSLHADTAWPALLRTQISAFLPNYMLPGVISVLDRLPRTPNGKIDRASLPRSIARSGDHERVLPQTATETVLVQLVAELLGHDEFGCDDDLFLLGFHSLLAVRLVARIARICGVTLALRVVFERPTIAGIAAEIDAAGAAGAAVAIAHTPIITYNETGSQTPIVFFHNDAAGEGMFCRRLAAAIGPTQPLVAIAPHGTAGLPPLTSVEAMAADYVDRLRALQPVGPYRVGGFCAGGLVAYELARLLHARGESVEAIFLVNASAPPRREVLFGDWLLRRIGLDERLDPSLRASVCWTVVRLFDAIGHGPLTAFRFLAGRASSALRRFRGVPNSGLNEPEPINPHPSPGETRSYLANLIAAYTYHPKPYAGELVFLWGTEQPLTPGGPTTGWDRVASNIRLIPVPGRHLTPVKEGVDHLGQVIAAEIYR